MAVLDQVLQAKLIGLQAWHQVRQDKVHAAIACEVNPRQSPVLLLSLTVPCVCYFARVRVTLLTSLRD